jgi:hypothetical protein
MQDGEEYTTAISPRKRIFPQLTSLPTTTQPKQERYKKVKQQIARAIPGKSGPYATVEFSIDFARLTSGREAEATNTKEDAAF